MSEEQRHRDAGTGEFVTKEFADANPETTIAETPVIDEPGSDSLMGSHMAEVTKLANEAQHDDENEEALTAATEAVDDGLPDAE